MCYAETATKDDGTATAFCYCGWTEQHPRPGDADTAAESHQRAADGAAREFAIS
jgi:hypothetical protein